MTHADDGKTVVIDPELVKATLRQDEHKAISTSARVIAVIVVYMLLGIFAAALGGYVLTVIYLIGLTLFALMGLVHYKMAGIGWAESLQNNERLLTMLKIAAKLLDAGADELEQPPPVEGDEWKH